MVTTAKKLQPFEKEIVEAYLNGATTTQLSKKYATDGRSIYHAVVNSGNEIRNCHNIIEKKYKDEALQLFDDGMSAIQISKKIGVADGTVLTFLKKHGRDTSKLSTKRERPLQKDFKKIIKMYNSGMSAISISKNFNCSSQSIDALFKKNGVDTTFVPKYECDYDFFKKISDEARAWTLGVWYSDGNNNRSGIRVNMCDLDIIEKIKAAMGYKGPIVSNPPRGIGKRAKHELAVSGVELADDLTNVGCMPNKTFILKYPDETILPKHLTRHFIRGLIDGDGTVNSRNVGLCGASPLIPQFQDVVKSYFPDMDLRAYDRMLKSNNMFYTRRVHNIKDCCRFLHWIYDDATIYGDRKFENAYKYWLYRERV